METTCKKNNDIGKKNLKFGLSRSRKFSSVLFVKIPSFICLVFEIENRF